MGETTKLSREHTVANPVPGLVLVAGGKLTTYRIMARDAVDHALRSSGGAFDPIPPSITDRVPLMGAWGFEARSNQRVDFAVRFPGRSADGQPVWLPIDAKFPREDYERLLDAQDRADVPAAESAAPPSTSRQRCSSACTRVQPT